jgi:hypothetical protein
MSAVGGVGTGMGMATIEFCETATRSLRFALAANLAMTRVVIASKTKLQKIRIRPIAGACFHHAYIRYVLSCNSKLARGSSQKNG